MAKTGVGVMDHGEHQPSEGDLKTKFTLKELTYLEQCMSPSEVSIAEGSPIAPATPRNNLVDKIGFALLDSVDGEKEVEIALSESECRSIREVTSITASVGGEAVGKDIKLKIYKLLRDYDNAKKMPPPQPEKPPRKKKSQDKSIPIREPNSEISKDEAKERMNEWELKQKPEA